MIGPGCGADGPEWESSVPGELRRVVTSPEGLQYEVLAKGKAWRLGTGSILLDLAGLLWSVVRRARGKEWVVMVRRADDRADPVRTLFAKTEQEAAASVAELAEALTSGQLDTSVDR